MNKKKLYTKAVMGEEIEGVAIAGVRELVVPGGKLLEALRGDVGKVAGELRVLRQHHSPPGHESVDQRLLPHRSEFRHHPN